MDAPTGYDHLLGLLDAHGHPVKGTAAKCPAHEDGTASLSVSAGADGRALVTCHAGCSFADIVGALGAHPSDLFAGGPGECKVCHPELARAEGGERVTYDYTDADGTLIYQVVRMPPKRFLQRQPATPSDANAKRERDGRWWVWSLKGVTPVVYRWPEVVAGIARGERIWIVEGERDVETLRALGHVATCNSGGAGKWTDAHTAALAGAVAVTVVADADGPGRVHAARVARDLRPHVGTVRVVEPGDGCKDVTDWCSAGLRVDDLPEWPTMRGPDPDDPGPPVPDDVADVRDGLTAAAGAVDGDLIPPPPRPSAPFPDDVLPDWMVEKVESAARSTGSSVDMLCMVALGLWAWACLGRRTIHLVEGAWVEMTGLYTVLSLPPGARKSSGLDSLTQVVRDFNDEMRLARISAAEQSVEEALRGEDRIAIAAAGVERDMAARWPGVLAGPDSTVEAFAWSMAQAQQYAGLSTLLVDDESTFLDNVITGRYTGGVPNLTLLNAAYTGGDYTQVRITRPSLHLRRAQLGMLILTQPGALADTRAVPAVVNRGLGSRMWMIDLPAPDPARSVPPNHDADAVWDQRFRSEMIHYQRHDSEVAVTLTPAAEEWVLERSFEMGGEALVSESAEVAMMLSRWCSILVRVADLLHRAWAPGPDVGALTLEDLQRAEQVVRWGHGLAVHLVESSGAYPDEQRMQRTLTGLVGRGWQRTRAIQRLWHRRYQTASQVDADLEHALDRGLILRRELPPPDRGVFGRGWPVPLMEWSVDGTNGDV